MATRRAAPYSFDHGTQFFTAKSEAFKSFITPLINAGVIVRWDARFAQIEINKITSQSIWSGEHHIMLELKHEHHRKIFEQ